MRVIVVEPHGLREPGSTKGDLSSEYLLHLYRQLVNKLGLGMVHVMEVGETGGLAISFGHHFPCAPSSELQIADFWYRTTALDDLLGVSVDKVNDDRLYRALDALLPHKSLS